MLRKHSWIGLEQSDLSQLCTSCGRAWVCLWPWWFTQAPGTCMWAHEMLVAAVVSLSKCSTPPGSGDVPRETNGPVKISMSQPGGGWISSQKERARVERKWDLLERAQVTPGWSPSFYLECKSVWKWQPKSELFYRQEWKHLSTVHAWHCKLV